VADDTRDAGAGGEPSRGDGEAPRRELIELDLWERFLAGHATDTESASVRAWAASVTGDAGAAEHLRTVLLTHPHPEAPPIVNADAFLVALRARLGLADPIAADVPHVRRDSPHIPPFRMPGTARPGASPHLWPRGVGRDATWRRSAVAASVLIALSAGLAVSALQHGARTVPSGREYATAAGQRMSVTLVDGTQLALAPASRVRIAPDYGRGARPREVEVEGEAYFAVVHDAAHPFAVKAHGAVARDVGTAFDVRAYPGDAGARVAVAAGAVAVSATGRCRADALRSHCGTQVQAGDVATVADTVVAVTHGADVPALTAWTHGELVFAEAPIRDVLVTVGRWYDLELRLSDPSMGAEPYTGSFSAESVDQVMETFALILHARIERHGRVVTFVRSAHP
jgi:transmembrane sensor